MGNFSANLFVLLSFWIPLNSPIIRRDSRALGAAWFTLAIHHAVCFFNAFIRPISTAWFDLYRFHEQAQRGGVDPYTFCLGILYKVFGTSFWLGSVCSIVAYSLSLLLLADTLRLLGKTQVLPLAILVYGLMPGPLVHCSVPLRESYQALCFAAIVWSVISTRKEGIRTWKFAVFSVSICSIVLLHTALLVFAVIAFVVSLPSIMDRRNSIVACLLLGVFVVGAQVALSSKIVEENSANTINLSVLYSICIGYDGQKLQHRVLFKFRLVTYRN